MKHKERIIWIGSVVIILAVASFVVFQYQTMLSITEKNKTSSNKYNTERLKDYAAQVVELKGEIETLKLTNYDKTTMLELERKGYTGQLKDVVADLKMHSELIPYKGILGGTMGFYSDNDIHVLTDRWVFAYFEDGHISGYMLLSYDINNGSIVWKVIDSFLDV